MRWWLLSGALALGLTACGPGDDEGGEWSGKSYVSIGDSYTAAPGTGANRGDDCYQSAVNYPRLIAEELDLDLHDVACGGARIDHLYEIQPGHDNPPQLNALTEDTDLVTIRIGANNNAVYFQSVVRCAQIGAGTPDGAPCTEQLRGEDYLATAAEQIRPALDQALADIASRAPNARIVVIGYPEWAPPEAPEECEAFALAVGDYAFARRANEMLVETLADAAEAADVDYVDTWSATVGHHMCADDPWVAGMQNTSEAAAVHPFPREQEVVAGLVVDLLES